MDRVWSRQCAFLCACLVSFFAFSVPLSGQQSFGFDFRKTAGFVTDPPGDTYVLSTMAYPTKANGVTFGWLKTSRVQSRDRNAKLDPRLAGVNMATNGTPATFYVDLPSAGTYNLSLAMGDASYEDCWKQCQIQFMDGNTVLATVTETLQKSGYFFDAQGNSWSAAAWPANNLSTQVTLTGSRLTMVMGTSKSTGDFTPIAYLGVAQASGGSPNYTLSASPASLSVAQGNAGTSIITTTISGGFNSAIALSASGVPSGTTVSFNPSTIPAPGAGNSTMSITVGASTPVGTYPITVTGNGGGIQQNTTVTLTVTAQQQPSFTLSASPASLSIPQGNRSTSTIIATISGGFNSSIALSASALPSGTTAAFSPNPIPAPGSGSSTMTITVGASTPVGTYPITVTGNGGGIQQPTTISLTVTGVTLDGTVHRVQDNGSNPSDTAVVSIGTPTAGDLITCEVTFDGHNNNALVSVTDNNNGSYGVAVPAHLNTTLVQWFGIYYRENVAGSPTTVTLTTSQSQPWSAISCQAWKGAASSNSLDLGFVQSQDGLSIPNPTTGSNKTPAMNGELVIAGAGLYSSGTPTAGANYALIDSAPATQWWPEYWIQTTATATAGNYTWQTDSWTDMMASFRPAAATGNFTISASPSSLSIAQGNQGTSVFTTTINGGFNSAISLSASGAPTGTIVSFSPQTIPPPGSGNSTMTITVGASTPPGTYPITVTGNGGGVQQSTTVTLTVTAQANFTILASPSSISVVQGNQGTSVITTTISNSFNSAITLSASGVPSGTTVSFNPQTIPPPGSGNSTMTITVGASTPPGTYPITVTGNGGGVQRTASVTLTVTAQVALSWTASSSPGIAGYNAYRSTNSNGPYSKLNASLISTTNYNDQSVQSGNTYYYVTTAVDSAGEESVYSNQATATVP